MFYITLIYKLWISKMDKYDQYYNLTFFKFLFFETFKMYCLSEQYM